jgi:hypothetical protein
LTADPWSIYEEPVRAVEQRTRRALRERHIGRMEEISAADFPSLKRKGGVGQNLPEGVGVDAVITGFRREH